MYFFNNNIDTDISHKTKIEPLSVKSELKLDNITFSYPDTSKPVIKDLNIRIHVIPRLRLSVLPVVAKLQSLILF